MQHSLPLCGYIPSQLKILEGEQFFLPETHSVDLSCFQLVSAVMFEVFFFFPFICLHPNNIFRLVS